MSQKIINNQQGFVLITSLMMLVVLMVIGIAATNTSTIELQISGNDKANKQTFYLAEAGLQAGGELIEQSIFDFPDGDLNTNSDGQPIVGRLILTEADYTLLQLKPYFEPDTLDPDSDVPDAYFSLEEESPSLTTRPRTDLYIGGQSVFNAGGSIQMLAGYEGKGKGAAAGGAGRLYDIHSIAYGPNNSQSWLVAQWLHAL